jgi:AcrR family transcriptional regulator
MTDAPAPPDRRARYREQTRDEVKRVALQQLAEAGTDGLSLNAIAKRIGLTGPALYRYFTNRDALLTALIIDAYDDLATAVETADAAAADRPATDRLRAAVHAFRDWALTEPHRYLLLFGSPVPGYVAPAETVAAAHRTMTVILAGITRVAAERDTPEPARPSTLEVQLQRWGQRVGEDIAVAKPHLLRLAVTGWTRMHGVVSAEISGGFTLMEFDPGLLFDAELESLLSEI